MESSDVKRLELEEEKSRLKRMYANLAMEFNVIDDCTREALAIEVDTSIASKLVNRVLGQVINERGKPKIFRVDNRPEFTSKEFTSWCEMQGISILFIQPGRPIQNGFIQRFNGLCRPKITLQKKKNVCLQPLTTLLKLLKLV